MATALKAHQTMDFKGMALQAQQLKDNNGAAVNMTELTALTGATATIAEINRVTDVSTRVVAVTTATLAVAEATHESKTVTLARTGGIVSTLPAATGGGARYRFVIAQLDTTGYVFSPTGNDTMKGTLLILDLDSTAETAYGAASGNNTITLNGTTKGGQVGDWVEFEDVAADVWAVRGSLQCAAGSNIANPFSTV